jgi:hypothetical protein
MSAPWPLRAAATAAPALVALLALFAARDVPLRLAPGGLGWALLVRGPAPDGTVRDGAAVALPGLPRERTSAPVRQATGEGGLAIGSDGGPLEAARLTSGGVASRIPPSGTRGARLELRPVGSPVRVRAIEVRSGAFPWGRLLPALFVPPLVVLGLRRRLEARLALALGFLTSALLLLASMPLLDALVPVRAAAWLVPAASGIAAAMALRTQGLLRASVIVAAFVFGAWIRVVFLPSAGSWDTEYWKAWTARGRFGVARVYGDADAVPPGTSSRSCADASRCGWCPTAGATSWWTIRRWPWRCGAGRRVRSLGSRRGWTTGKPRTSRSSCPRCWATWRRSCCSWPSSARPLRARPGWRPRTGRCRCRG